MEMFMLFMLASVGATIIVTGSTLFEPVRNLFVLKDSQRESNIIAGTEKGTKKESVLLFFKDLIHCPMCLGFWMGCVMYFIVGFKVSSLQDVGFLFAYSCSSSLGSIFMYSKLK